jgi:nucleoside-diphosphate-sugar epimerase
MSDGSGDSAGSRLLVAGGSGFIGTHTVAAALAAGDDVVNVDIRRPLLGEQGDHWRELDLMDAEGLKRLVAEFRPDAIVNLAAVADLALSYEDMAVNYVGVENLVGAARAVDAPPRIVHISTQLVVEPGYAPSGPRDYRPYSEYGKTKATSEEVLWTHADDLEWTIARPTNVWGPYHPSFALSTWKYLNRRWYAIPRGARTIRSFGYVENVAAQLLAAAKGPAEAVDHQVFYVGDEPMPLATWLDGFSRTLTGKPARRVPRALLKAGAEAGELIKRAGRGAPFDRGRLFRITADYAVPMAPALEALGRGPVSREQGIADTVDWLRREHPAEFKRR